MRKAAQSSQSELAALQKSLDLEFDATKLARAQKVAQDAIDQTAANADVLRRRLEYLEETGNVDTTAYRKLQTELAQTELKGQQLQKQLEKLNTLKFDKLSSRITASATRLRARGAPLRRFPRRRVRQLRRRARSVLKLRRRAHKSTIFRCASAFPPKKYKNINTLQHKRASSGRFLKKHS